ncbi:protein PRRC1-like [Styela clava]
MMEEVSHPVESGTLTPPPTAPPVVSSTSPPTQVGMTPPPQAPMSYSTSPPSSSYTPTSAPLQGSAYPSPMVQNPAPPTYPTSNYQGTPEASTIMLPDMPEYNTDQENRGDSGSAGGMWGWFRSASQNTFVQSVVEKTKTGVDRMITTLDPGMTPYLRQGGDISVIVASEKMVKWGAVRDAFQRVFGTANVKGIPAQSGVAPQPVGYAAGLRGARDRISYLRRSGLVDERQLCVAVESFIAELLPDKWFDIGCVMLEDPARNINLEMFTQAVPIPPEIVSHVQSATPSDYNLSWSGLSVTIGQAFQHHMPWVQPTDWHKTLTGQSRQTIIYDAVVTLAGLYQEKLPKTTPGRPI